MSPIAHRILAQRAASLRPPLGVVPPGAVSLALGEPDFSPPQEVIDASVQAVEQGRVNYTDQHGIAELRDALLQALPARPASWDRNNVVVTHGATGGLGAIFFALIEPGDKVVIPQPAYSLYADQVVLAGGTVEFVPMGSDLHFDFEKLAVALQGAKMVVFSNPSNPNGIVHTREELEKLAQLLDGTDTIVVSDEAYAALTYTEAPFISALEVEGLQQRTLYVQTFSKKYCMTGFRVGYVAGDKELIAAIAQFHRTFNGSVSEPAQLAALAAIQLPETTFAPMLGEYRRRRDLVVHLLNDVPHIHLVQPEGAFYAFFAYDTGQDSSQVAADLADRGVLVRAGAEYGPDAEGHIRLSFAASQDDIQRGIGIIRDYFAES
jgi:aspartate aminotransferase